MLKIAIVAIFGLVASVKGQQCDQSMTTCMQAVNQKYHGIYQGCSGTHRCAARQHPIHVREYGACVVSNCNGAGSPTCAQELGSLAKKWTDLAWDRCGHIGDRNCGIESVAEGTNGILRDLLTTDVCSVCNEAAGRCAAAANLAYNNFITFCNSPPGATVPNCASMAQTAKQGSLTQCDNCRTDCSNTTPQAWPPTHAGNPCPQ